MQALNFGSKFLEPKPQNLKPHTVNPLWVWGGRTCRSSRARALRDAGQALNQRWTGLIRIPSPPARLIMSISNVAPPSKGNERRLAVIGMCWGVFVRPKDVDAAIVASLGAPKHVWEYERRELPARISIGVLGRNSHPLFDCMLWLRHSAAALARKLRAEGIRHSQGT